MALSLKKMSDAGIPLDVVLEYFKSIKEVALLEKSNIKTVSENFMREIREDHEKGNFEKKVREEEEKLRSLRGKIRILTKPAGVF